MLHRFSNWKLSQRMARHERDCKSCLFNQYKSPKTLSSLWNRLMSSRLKTVKWFLLKNAHAKTEATRKERNRIDWKWENNKSRLNSLVLTDVLKRSDLNGRDYATGGHHLDQKKQHQIFNQRIVQKKKDKQHPKNERSKYKKEETLEK